MLGTIIAYQVDLHIPQHRNRCNVNQNVGYDVEDSVCLVKGLLCRWINTVPCHLISQIPEFGWW